MEPQFLAAPKMKPFAPLSVRKTGLPDDSGCQHVFSVVAAVVKRELRESQCFKCDRGYTLRWRCTPGACQGGAELPGVSEHNGNVALSEHGAQRSNMQCSAGQCLRQQCAEAQCTCNLLGSMVGRGEAGLGGRCPMDG